jgi:hypothetical protein
VKRANSELILPALERKEELQARGETATPDTTQEEPNWSFGLRTMPRCNYRTAPVSVAHQTNTEKNKSGKGVFFFPRLPPIRGFASAGGLDGDSQPPLQEDPATPREHGQGRPTWRP